MTDDRIPWWALLVHAPLARVEAQIEKLRWPTRDEEDHLALVANPDGAWTVLYRYDRSELDLQIAGKLRALGEVIVLSFDDYGPHVRRFQGTKWMYLDEDPGQVERALGFARGAMPAAETREAALIVGGDRAALAKKWPHAERVVATERGVVVTGIDAGHAAADTGLHAYHVVHNLANDDFYVFVIDDGGHTGLFDPAGGPSGGLAALADIEGETEPRKIVRALGLPEDYLFPE